MTNAFGRILRSWAPPRPGRLPRFGALILVIAAAGCGGEREQTDSGEHALAEQQRALERSKAAADAVESASEAREARSQKPD